AYESLTKEQKNLIPNLKKLTALETGIVALEKEAAEQAKNQQVANEVIAHIDALPTKADVTLADKSKVENAQKAYDNLMKAQQKLVTNLEKLTALESQIVALEKEAADKQAAKEVLSTIDALPTKADVTLADKFKVENARNAFDNLKKAQQKLVTNLEKLTAIESHIVVLENEVAEDEVNKYAANKVTTIINALPKEVNITL